MDFRLSTPTYEHQKRPIGLSLVRLGLAIMGLTQGCATQTQPLSHCNLQTWADWGQSDGLSGKGMDSAEAWASQCEAPPSSEELAAYNENRLEGLKSYCTPKKGFVVGASGRPYLFVCGESTEPAFLKAFHFGRSQFRIEERTRDLNLQIRTLTAQLASPLIDSHQRNFLQKEIEGLKGSLELSQKELKFLESKKQM